MSGYTKLHEEIWRGSVSEAIDRCTEVDPRGEYVLVLEGAPPAAEATEEEIREAVELALSRGLSKKDAAAEVAELFAVARNRVYEIAIAL